MWRSTTRWLNISKIYAYANKLRAKSRFELESPIIKNGCSSLSYLAFLSAYAYFCFFFKQILLSTGFNCLHVNSFEFKSNEGHEYATRQSSDNIMVLQHNNCYYCALNLTLFSLFITSPISFSQSCRSIDVTWRHTMSPRYTQRHKLVTGTHWKCLLLAK